PGAPAFIYVAEHLQDQLLSPLRGWMGHAAPFDFTTDYVPASGIDRFLAGTPPILSLAALESALDTFDGLSMQAIWEKSMALFDNIHEIAGWIAEKETAKSPIFCGRPVHHFGARSANGRLRGIKIVYAY